MNSESSAISTRVAIVIRRTEEPSLNRSPAVLSGENYWMFVVAHAPPIGRLPIGDGHALCVSDVKATRRRSGPVLSNPVTERRSTERRGPKS